MQHIGRWLAGALAALTALFCALNWVALTAPGIVDLGFGQVQAPLGLVLLALTTGLLLVLLAMLVRARWTAQRESYVLHRDLHAAQALADRAEASRFEELQQVVKAEFQALNQRCGAIETALQARPPAAPQAPLP